MEYTKQTLLLVYGTYEEQSCVPGCRYLCRRCTSAVLLKFGVWPLTELTISTQNGPLFSSI